VLRERERSCRKRRKIHFVNDDLGLDQMCSTSSGKVRKMSYARKASDATGPQVDQVPVGNGSRRKDRLQLTTHTVHDLSRARVSFAHDRHRVPPASLLDVL
jgi:hypothetical protein